MVSKRPLVSCALLFCSPLHREIALALAKICEQAGLTAHVYQEEDAEIGHAFMQINKQAQRLTLVFHAGGHLLKKSALKTTCAEFVDTWRSTCFSGAVIGQHAMKAMLPNKQGSMIFIGHVAGVDPQNDAAAYGSASAGLRSFAQSMAREFGPKGIHVAHVLSHGNMQGNNGPTPQEVANACWQLHLQHSSTWTHELDLKPALEST